MSPDLVVLLVVVIVLLAPFALLTAWGAHRRGRGRVVAALAGLLFPGTWAVWYVRDEHPYRRATDDRSRPEGRPGAESTDGTINV